jgi:hypothetical protein
MVEEVTIRGEILQPTGQEGIKVISLATISKDTPILIETFLFSLPVSLSITRHTEIRHTTAYVP